ncbi:hypothetical protein SK128_024984, partial [Halocaridina rubra]
QEKHVVRSPFHSVELPNESLPSIVFRRAAKWSHLDSIECGITGRKNTYGGVINRALRWGTVINKLLPPFVTLPGQRNIVYFSPNCPEFPVVFYGTQAVGATITCMNHTYTIAEVSRELNDCDASAMVADPKYEQILLSAFQNLKKTTSSFHHRPLGLRQHKPARGY